MSKSNKPNKKAAPALTLEQQAQVLADIKKHQEEAEAERQRVELYGKSIETMSHRQLSSELRKTVKREHAGRPLEPIAGLTIAWASVLNTVLSSTKTVPVFEQDKKGRIIRAARPDQINPNWQLRTYPV